jgi:hypothetical protein
MIMLTVPAMAAAKKPTPEQLCKLTGSWAQVVMRGRQLGMPISQNLNFANAPGAPRNSKAVVMSAYEVPRYSTQEMQQTAVEDFRNDVELACYKRAQ